ncbi:Rossmann-like and DUF2520 domain-containing protein [Paraflavitalea speifideaquila]|uniref:Rossmann-like and DUF2520 domain-containing protein n=1 Tax=Paraflavitalea speifideaquila TaxID=3076558 RepID=UPI0028EF1C9C|nr:DUF2520 domain-containing protein [Paraflavitalea speifideiaquila]
MRIVLIGTGNVATILGRKINSVGHEMVQVYGRTGARAKLLADQWQAAYTTSMEWIDKSADLYILAVADAALPAVAATLRVKDKLVVHTAGSVPSDVLKGCSTRYGILYPLQSLRWEMQALPEIPFLVDANTEDDQLLVRDFAISLSNRVSIANDEQRLQLHVAAVMVSNFTNHLYTLAEKYCKAQHVDFSLLHPLILQVAERLQVMSPHEAQTGPAIRQDAPTIKKHLELLEAHGEMRELYEWFTKSIQRESSIDNRSRQGAG